MHCVEEACVKHGFACDLKSIIHLFLPGGGIDAIPLDFFVAAAILINLDFVHMHYLAGLVCLKNVN